MTTREVDLDIPNVADLRTKWAAKQKEIEGRRVRPAWKPISPTLNPGPEIIGTVTQFPVRDDANGVYDAGSCLVEWDDPNWGHGCYGLLQLEFVGEEN